jgi:hypothetical protein
MRQLLRPKRVYAAAAVCCFVLFAVAALLYGNDWWLSGIVTVSILAWLAGVLAAIYAPAERRAPIGGAVVAGFLYILLALGPWFGASVGPWLLTTRALTIVETQWLARESQQQQLVYQTLAPSYYTGTTIPTGWSGGGYGWSGFQPSTVQGYITTTAPASGVAGGPTTFVAIGHWLCGVMAAAAGALAAAWIARRGRRRDEDSRAVGENPFAEQQK